MTKELENVKGFFLYFDQYEPLEDLTDEQCGQLLKAMFAKFQGHDFEFTDPMVKMAYKFFETSFKRDAEKYVNKCEKMRANINKRHQKNTDENNCIQLNTIEYKSKQLNTNEYKRTQQPEQDKNKTKENINTEIQIQRPGEGATRSKFIKPTVAEVDAYCLERGNGISGQEFVDHYDACGWVYGTGRKPVRDWKACVRTWEANRKKTTQYQQQPRARPVPAGQFDLQRQINIAHSVLAKLEAEDGSKHTDPGTATQNYGFNGHGHELRQGTAGATAPDMDAFA